MRQTLPGADALLRLGGYAKPQIRRDAPTVPQQPARVSVVVPCYNYGRFVGQCVNSILDQQGVDVEVLIVDDCSTDGSQEVVRSIAASDPRVRAIFHEQNRGHIQTYNDGFAEVTGDFVVLLSADDLLTPGSLGRATALFEAHPSVGLVYGTREEFSDAPPPFASAPIGWKLWSGSAWRADRFRSAKNVIHSPEAIVRREVLDVVGISYLVDLPHGGDFEMWLRAASVADVGAISGVPQAFYRVHADNMSRTVYAGLLRDLEERRKVFEIAAAHPGERGGARLLKIARRTLAREALLAAWQHCSTAGDNADFPLEALRNFAVTTWPEIRRSIMWRSLDRMILDPTLVQKRRAAIGFLPFRLERKWRKLVSTAWNEI